MPLASYAIGEVFTATGTAESTAASAAVVGTGTAFTTEFAAGYLIIIAGETRVVDVVTDNTNLTVTAVFTVGSGGGAVAFTGVNLLNVESLGTPLDPPQSKFQQYSQSIELASAGVRGAGWIISTWLWGFMLVADYQQMRTFCTGKSNDVYITTKDDDEDYVTYGCEMVWPEAPDRKNGRMLEVLISFRNMVAI